MNKLLVVVFETEAQAYEGQRALMDLHRGGDIALYATAVVVKDPSGRVSVVKAADPEPIGTGLGLLTGSLIGMVGGPVGVAVGATTAGLTGAMFDLANAAIGADFLAQASAALEPGCAAVLAEADEPWVTPVDVRLGKLGGRVLRRQRREVVADMLQRDAEELNAELKALETELNQASAENRASLQARLDETRKNLEALQRRVETRQAEMLREMTARVSALRQQAETANNAAKARIEKDSATIKDEYEARRARLEQAGRLIKDALSPKAHS